MIVPNYITAHSKDKNDYIHRYICRLAHTYSRTYPAVFDFTDFYQEGYIGYMQASKSYDPDHSKSSLGFIFMRIRGAMVDLIRRNFGRGCKKSSPAQTTTLDHITMMIGQVPNELSFLKSRLVDTIWEAMVVRGIKPKWVLAYFLYHYREDITMLDIGKLVGVTDSRVSQVFKEMNGKAFWENRFFKDCMKRIVWSDEAGQDLYNQTMHVLKEEGRVAA